VQTESQESQSSNYFSTFFELRWLSPKKAGMLRITSGSQSGSRRVTSVTSEKQPIVRVFIVYFNTLDISRHRHHHCVSFFYSLPREFTVLHSVPRVSAIRTPRPCLALLADTCKISFEFIFSITPGFIRVSRTEVVVDTLHAEMLVCRRWDNGDTLSPILGNRDGFLFVLLRRLQHRVRWIGQSLHQIQGLVPLDHH
jgi:hypothetical protein